MPLRTPIALAAALFLAASTGLASQEKAPNLTGNWIGTFTSTTSTGEPDEDPAYLSLKQTGEELTGTAGPRADRQMPIAKGKVTTEKGVTAVTFDVTEPSGGPAIHFALKLVDGRLKGTAIGESDGQKRTATVDVAREK
jgi:hypothetical protein